MLRELCGNFLLYKTLDRVRYRIASISVKYRVTKTICREAELYKNRFKLVVRKKKSLTLAYGMRQCVARGADRIITYFAAYLLYIFKKRRNRLASDELRVSS